MFHLPPDPFGPGCCGCCPGGEHVYRTVDELAWDVTALTFRRLGHTDSIETVRKIHRADDVAYLEMELAAALALVEDALSLLPEMLDIIGPSLREAMNASEVYDAIGRADSVWRAQSFGKGTAQKWEEAITLAVATGVHQASDAVFVPKYMRQSMIDGMVRAGKYYTNNYFNTQVMPSLITSVEKVVSGDLAGAKAGYNLVRETLTARLKSVPYWNVVANAAASRSYHYGYLRAGQMAGHTSYRFVAVMDRRTSDLCASLNGEEWSVSEGLGLMQRVAEAEHPEDLKTIVPWMKYDDVKDLDNRGLSAAGIMVPPLHGRCRSTLKLL